MGGMQVHTVREAMRSGCCIWRCARRWSRRFLWRAAPLLAAAFSHARSSSAPAAQCQPRQAQGRWLPCNTHEPATSMGA